MVLFKSRFNHIKMTETMQLIRKIFLNLIFHILNILVLLNVIISKNKRCQIKINEKSNNIIMLLIASLSYFSVSL